MEEDLCEVCEKNKYDKIMSYKKHKVCNECFEKNPKKVAKLAFDAFWGKDRRKK